MGLIDIEKDLWVIWTGSESKLEVTEIDLENKGVTLVYQWYSCISPTNIHKYTHTYIRDIHIHPNVIHAKYLFFVSMNCSSIFSSI